MLRGDKNSTFQRTYQLNVFEGQENKRKGRYNLNKKKHVKSKKQDTSG